MAFHDPGDLLIHAHRTHQVSAALGVEDRVRPAPSDIVEHGTLFHEGKNNFGVPFCIFAGTIPHRPAMGDNFPTAPGIVQESFTFFSN
jgi:hypothetical protein